MALRLFLCVLAGFFAHSAVARALKISGSDLLSETLQAAISKQLAEGGIQATFILQGSLLASGDLQAGAADAALLAVPAGGQPFSGLRSYPFAFQIVTVAVHPSNPLREVSYSQLASIFSEEGEINNWSQLNSGVEWRDRKITRLAYRKPGLITLEIFNADVVRGSFKADMRSIAASPSALGSAIFDDISLIGLFPHLPAGTDLRPLAIKQEGSQQGFTPSADNVFFGDYNLRLPFVFVVSDSVAPSELADVMQALYSPAVTAALEAEGYMPVPVSERQASLQALNR